MQAATQRRLRIFAFIWLVYALLCLPILIWPDYLDSPVGLLIAIPYLSIYLFDMAGIPDLLQNNGMCGWGWCAPSLFGWIFLGVVWVGAVWLGACLIERFRKRSQAD